MFEKHNEKVKLRIDKIKQLLNPGRGSEGCLEAGALALTVIDDTVGGSHSLWSILESALKSSDWERARDTSLGIVTLYEQGTLNSPRLAIAHEIEGDFIEIANVQAQAAEIEKDINKKQFHLYKLN
jgi:hypothetical protein